MHRRDMGMMRVQLTVRVEPHTAEYVAAAATQAGISLSEAGRALFELAEAEGWQITPAALQTSRPGHLTPPGTGPGPTTNHPES